MMRLCHCGTEVERGRACPTCKRARWNRIDSQRSAEEIKRRRIYWRKSWQATRRRVLGQEPFCAICKRMPSVDVDHIDGDNSNMARENLQGLCKACHTKKTAAEKR